MLVFSRVLLYALLFPLLHSGFSLHLYLSVQKTSLQCLRSFLRAPSPTVSSRLLGPNLLLHLFIVSGKDVILDSVVHANNGAFLIPLPPFNLPWTSSFTLLSSTIQMSQSSGHLSLNAATFPDSALITSLLDYYIHLWAEHPALVCSRPPHSPPSTPSDLPKIQFILFHSSAPLPSSSIPSSRLQVWLVERGSI